ncbi:uncharacterized protein [Chironomus tepperi]|uniref:uncharacterized protein n=1 Tax=Chironomus tepperi TaxID=113505 RepID=UPI00391F0473
MASTKLILVILTSLVANAYGSFWTSCANGRPPISVDSPSCTGTRCLAVRGENIVLNVESDFIEAHPLLRPRAFAIVLGVPIQIPDDPAFADICPLLNVNGVQRGCPTAPNTVYQWTLDMLIPTAIPAFQNGRIRVELLDAGRVVHCFEVLGTML